MVNEMIAMIGLISKAGVIVIAVITLLLLAIRFMKGHVSQNGTEQEKSIADDIIAAISDKTCISNIETAKAELCNVINDGGLLRTSGLELILRIECRFSRKSAGLYDRELTILYRKSDKVGGKVKVSRSVYYDDLPAAVREQLIKSGKEQAIAVLYSRSED